MANRNKLTINMVELRRRMEAREALRREAARERAQKGMQGGIGTVGSASHSMPIFRPQRAPASHQGGGGGSVQSGPPQGLFGAPVKLKEEDETSRRLKNVLGDYKSIQGSPMATGPLSSSHSVYGHSSATASLGSLYPTSGGHSQSQPPPLQHAQQPQQPLAAASLLTSQQEQQQHPPSRRSQPPQTSSDSRSGTRHANGVASPGRQAALASKAAMGATNQSGGPLPPKASFVSAAARKSIQPEQSGGTLRSSSGHSTAVVGTGDQQQQAQHLAKMRSSSGGLGPPKNGASNNNRYPTGPDSNALLGNAPVNNLSTSTAAVTSTPTSGKELVVRLEEVLREMKVPPLLPEIDDGGGHERERSREPGWDRVEKSENRLHRTDGRDIRMTESPAALTSSQNNTAAVPPIAQLAGEPLRFTTLSSPELAEMAAAGEIAPLLLGSGRCGTLAGVEAPPDAHSPVRSPTPANGHAPCAPFPTTVQSSVPTGPPPTAAVTASVNSSITTARNSSVPAESEVDGASRRNIIPTGITNLSSPGSSSDSDDDDDHESISQEDSQDSDVEQNNSMRMTISDTQFPSTENFSEKIAPFGEFGPGSSAPSGMFPQQSQPLPSRTEAIPTGSVPLTSQTTLPVSHSSVPSVNVDSSKVQAVDSSNSASDDASADADAKNSSSWSLAAFISGATPNSVASVTSVKSPRKSSPRTSPTAIEASSSSTRKAERKIQNRTPTSESERRKRKRTSSRSEARSKESSLEPPTSSAEKRRAVSDQKASGSQQQQQLNASAAVAAAAASRGVVQQLHLPPSSSASRSVRSSATPEPDHNSNSSPLVKGGGGGGSVAPASSTKSRNSQISSRVMSPLIQHNTDSNSSVADVGDRRLRDATSGEVARSSSRSGGGSSKRRKHSASSRTDADDEEGAGLVVRIPFSRLKRRPGQAKSQQQQQPTSEAKCDSGSSRNDASAATAGSNSERGTDRSEGKVTGTTSAAVPIAVPTPAAARAPSRTGDDSNKEGRSGSAKDSSSTAALTAQTTPQRRSKERDMDSPMSIDSNSSGTSGVVKSSSSHNVTNSSSNNSGSSSSKNRRKQHGSDGDERSSKRKDDDKEKRKRDRKDKDKSKDKSSSSKTAAASDGASTRPDKSEKSSEKASSSTEKDSVTPGGATSSSVKDRERSERDRSDKRDEKRKDRDRSKAESKDDTSRKDATKEEKSSSSKSKSPEGTTSSKKDKENSSASSSSKDVTAGGKPLPEASAVKVKEDKESADSVKTKYDVKRRSGSDETTRKSEGSSSGSTSTAAVAVAASSKEQPKDKWMRNRMLSDAAERMETESKITMPDWFITEAKKLKHDGDKERMASGQVKKYLESALFFLLSGNLIEVMPNRTDVSRQAQKMYMDTLTLVRHVSSRLYKPPGTAGVRESRLIILSLRVQAVLNHRIFAIMGRDREFKDRSVSALREFQSLKIAKSSNSEGSVLSNGATASPAGSHSSASSGVLLAGSSTRDNGVPGSSQNAQGGSGQQSTKTYNLPAPLVENMQKIAIRYVHIERAHDLWQQSCTYMMETNNKEFFDAAANASSSGGSVDIFSSSSEFVKFARETIFRIEELANVS